MQFKFFFQIFHFSVFEIKTAANKINSENIQLEHNILIQFKRDTQNY